MSARRLDIEVDYTHLKLSVGYCPSTDTRVPTSLEAFIQDVLAPSVPVVAGIDVTHAALLADVSIVIALAGLDDQVA